MDTSPFLNPTVLIGLGMAVIGFIVWLVRLEGKASTNLANNIRLETELAVLAADAEKHKANGDIHFNLRVMQQVEKGNEQRFHTIETQLSEINRKLDNMAGRA